jgi:AraC-like DNA-binding protein
MALSTFLCTAIDPIKSGQILVSHTLQPVQLFSRIPGVLVPEAMEFAQESAISPALRNVVQRFWQVDRRVGKFVRETIIPKGSVEIIFNLQDDSYTIPAVIGGNEHKLPRCFISGYHTVPISLQIPGRQLFFGVFVNPTALKKIFRVQGKDYVNQCIDLASIDPSMNSLWHQLADQTTFNQRINIFTDWLMKRLPDTSGHEKLFDQFLTSISTSPTSADEVSKMLCYSPRHLSRKLYELTAMNLEQTLLYRRYLRAIDLMHHSTLQLTEIAYTCNFSDQSHFTKTFRSYACMKPKEYRAAKSHVSGHIFEG